MRAQIAPALALVSLASLSAPGAANAQAVSLDAVSRSLQGLTERVRPSVVQVFTTAYTPGQGVVPGVGDLLTTERGSGSGVILDPEGYVVTSAHVVAGARRIQVQLFRVPREGGSILEAPGRIVGAQLVGLDEETDIAVLKIQESGLPALALADSDTLRAGQLVLALGAPLGLSNTVTLGVVSAVARQLRPDDRMIYVQTDAPINPGSSGGPLLDTEGRVVGVNAMIFSQSGGSEGVGFAAPSNIVRHVYEQIRRHRRVRRGEIGVVAQTLTPALARGLGLDRDEGALLADVLPGSPAEAAGVRAGDVVERLDGKPIENARQLHVNLYQRAVGDVVKLELSRGGRLLKLQVPVLERADDPRRLASLVDPDRNLVPRLGILALTVDEGVAAMIPRLRHPGGVVVASTAADALGPGEGGFLPGDVIHAVNGAEVASLAALHAALSGLRFGDAIVVQIERGGVRRYLAFFAQ